jgi:hypothetical protein
MILLRNLVIFMALATALSLNGLPNPSDLTATCTGSDPCNACKNCKYCKHCAKEGGRCGICKNLLNQHDVTAPSGSNANGL